jgi:hypothetical protein
MDSSPRAYTSLAETLSQGDIVHGLPWAVLEHPLVVCRPDGGKPGRAFYAEPKDCVRQPAFSRGAEIIHAVGREIGSAMVIWEDCQVDKMRSQHKDERKWFVAVAPVVPLTVVQEEEYRQAIRDGRRQAFFPLPSYEAVGLPESYVDLRLIWPVRQAMLQSRVTTLSPEHRSALYGHLLTFLTGRTLAATVQCPACRQTIPSDVFLESIVEPR